MSMSAKLRPRHGFTLLELVIYLAILSTLSLLTTQVFRATVYNWRETAARHADQARFDSALRRLRADVWSASEMELKGPGRLVLHFPAGPEVTWTAEVGRLTRVSSDDAAGITWGPLIGLSFSARGPALHVHSEGDAHDAVLTSQMMALAGGAR